jgi:hypothetical protein
MSSSNCDPALERKGSTEVRTRFEPKEWADLALLTVLYVALVCMKATRRLWYDELLTYHIAIASSLGRLFDVFKKWDLNPPTTSLLSRISINLFGDNALAVRLPSILEFYAGSLFLFFYVRRKASTAYAAIPLLILWYSPFFRYATEARSYALVFMFFSSLLLCWDIATTSKHRRAAVWGAGISTAGLVAAHVFSVLSIVPFLAAEMVRSIQRRKPDYALWSALLIPCIGVLSYEPLIASYRRIIYYPPEFQASLTKAFSFYWHNLLEIVLVLFLVLAAGVAVTKTNHGSGRVPAPPGESAWPTLVLFGVLLANPVILNLVLSRGHGAFWDRYCITTAVAAFLLFGLWLARKFSPLPARAGAIAGACLIAIQVVVLPLISEFRYGSPAKNAAVLQKVKPDLPLVAASGLTFVEISQYENASIVSRLYYLTDRCAAIRYAHATLFERMGDLVKDFGLRGTVEPYTKFISQHQQFLVLGTFGYPEDWLLDKLVADGATVTPAGYLPIPYKDKSVYEVTYRTPTGLGGATGLSR